MIRKLTRMLLLLPLLGCSCSDDEGENRVSWSFPDSITEDLAPPANSDIVLENSVLIPANVSLTLLPGTKLIFANNSTLQVRGNLVVDGPVEMAARNSAELDWSFIVSPSDGISCQIEDLQANGGNPALWLQGGSPQVDGFTASNSALPLKISSPTGGLVQRVSLRSTGRTGAGLDAIDGSALVVDDLQIQGFENGIQLNNCSITIRNALVQDCSIGMYLSHGMGRLEYSTFKNCIYGCRYVYTSSTDLYRVQFQDMTNGVQLHAFALVTDFDELNFINTPIAFRYLPDAAEYTPPRTIDVTGCYFGTADSSTITGMLVDAVDLGGNVDTLRFMPFATSPWSVVP
ncbi:MAG: right-handed parallel beta-helix repeat-containing protein [Candidatus Delongbacteria bacterium]